MVNQLHYKLSGSGEPVVLMHGLFGSHENLNNLIRHLESEYQVLAIDLPGHGRSDQLKEYNLNLMSEAIAELISLLNLKGIKLLGHSLGGKVAMKLALSQSVEVVKLVVADIAPVKTGSRHQTVFAGLEAVKLTEISTRQEADAMMAAHIEDVGVRQFLLRSLFKSEQGFQWRFDLKGLKTDYDQLIDAVTSTQAFEKPVLFIKGGNSDYLTADHQDAVGALFPNAKVKVILGAGHWLHAEKPESFNRIVTNFFAE